MGEFARERWCPTLGRDWPRPSLRSSHPGGRSTVKHGVPFQPTGFHARKIAGMGAWLLETTAGRRDLLIASRLRQTATWIRSRSTHYKRSPRTWRLKLTDRGRRSALEPEEGTEGPGAAKRRCQFCTSPRTNDARLRTRSKMLGRYLAFGSGRHRQVMDIRAAPESRRPRPRTRTQLSAVPPPHSHLVPFESKPTGRHRL